MALFGFSPTQESSGGGWKRVVLWRRNSTGRNASYAAHGGFWRVWGGTLVGIAVSLAWIPVGVSQQVGEQAGEQVLSDGEQIERYLAEIVEYLTSEELEGRGVGTKGLDLAAQYLAQQFAKVGLKTQGYQGTPFQTLVLSRGTKLGSENRLRLVGPPSQSGGKSQVLELRLGEDYMPMAMSGSGELDLPVVFAGYGITAPKENYDDYAGIDVRGKAVLILRHEPRQADSKSPFAGVQLSQYAAFTQKVANARQHGAAAVLICSDKFDLDKAVTEARKAWHETKGRLAHMEEELQRKQKAGLPKEILEAHRRQIETLQKQLAVLEAKLQPEYDPLMPLESGPPPSDKNEIPVIYCRRAVVDLMVQLALRKDLAELEAEIDQTFKPQSALLSGWRLAGRVDIRTQSMEIKNVVGLLEAQGALAQQHIILGAHYDHLGYGGLGSFLPWKRSIHPGADDNASGVAVMLAAARLLAERKEKLKRSVLCIAFTAEERGLVGSRHYVQHPFWPLDRCIAMINLDMVGRLRDDRLTVMGVGTAKQFGPLLDHFAVPYGLQMRKISSGTGPSDQMPFYGRQIPVLHLFTGMHSDYHRPSDTADKLNIPGMRRISQLVADLIEALANAPEAPEYVAVAGNVSIPMIGRDRPFLGTVPDFDREGNGYAISGIVPGSPAEKAGLKPGDVIIRFNNQPIASLADIHAALSNHKSGDKVRLIVQRDHQEVRLEVILGTRP